MEVSSKFVQEELKMPAKQPATVIGWDIVAVNETPVGGAQIWENNEGKQIQLPKGMVPDEKTLTMLALNGVEPKFPGELPELDDPETEDEADDPNEIAVRRVLAALTNSDVESGGRLDIRVSKFMADGKEAYCAKFSAEDFETSDLDLIRQSYGPGRYRIKVMATTPKTDAQGNPVKYGGRMVIRANQIVEIVQPLKPLESDAKNTANAPESMMLQFMERQSQQMRELVEALTKRPDPNADFRSMMQNMKLMREAMGINGNQQSGDGVEKVMRMMTQIDEFRDRFGSKKSGEGDESPLLRVAGQLVEVVKEAQAAKANQPQAAIPQVSVPASIAGAQLPAPSSENEPELTPEDEMQFFQKLVINARLKILCAKAAADEPVGKYAEELAGELPDDVLEMMTQPEWFAVLSQETMFPIVKPHEAWFTKLRDEIIRLLKESGDLDENGKLVPENEDE